MPPRKKSRLTPVVVSGKKKPTAFKALCLPNTDFMIDFLGFFTRDDFEKYLKLTCMRMNQLILTHFHSKPYRYLDNVTLMCNLVRNMELSLSKPAVNSASTILWDPYQRKWGTSSNYKVGLSKMLQFLDKSVRVPKVKIRIIFTVMTQEIIDQLKSISYIWENGKVEVITCIISMEDFMSREEVDLNSIVQLVENRALYPHSQTPFVFSDHRCGSAPLFTKTVLQRICNKLIESDKAQSFQIVFAIYGSFKLQHGEMDGFSIENKCSQEILLLRRVTHSEVFKYCEFNATAKYFVLERFQV